MPVDSSTHVSTVANSFGGYSTLKRAQRQARKLADGEPYVVPQDQLDRPSGGVQLARPGPLPLAGEVLPGPAPRARERREQAPHRRPPRPARVPRQGRIERGHLDRQGDSTGGHRRRLLALDGGSPAVLQDQGPSSTERTLPIIPGPE